MADSGRCSDKTSRKVKDTYQSISRSRDEKYNRNEHRHKTESRTPPLHARRPSIDELMEKRQNLRRQLKKYSDIESDKYSNNLKSRPNSSSRSHRNNPYEIPRRQRNSSGDERDRKKRESKTILPELHQTYTSIDSDDEEKIIEKRRQKRKKLIEKLNNSQNKECNSNTALDQDEEKSSELTCKKTDEQTKISTHGKLAPKATDMFSEDDFTTKTNPEEVKQDNNVENAAQLADNWDDDEGYYNVKIGDVINNKYVVKNILGKGVFANVVRATDQDKAKDVAIKIIRQNDLMYKTSLKEISFLKEIRQADPEHKNHCVKLLAQFSHKGHLCLVLEPLHMDLRSVIKKYGKSNGIDIRALMGYSRQLLLALKLLKSLEIIHADIKPDNILINETKTTLKLCDFGSATKIDDQDYTPYLVSRYYRAPEIILGMRFNYGIDIWSVACTIFEMATGKILFTGSSNNRMLKLFMEVKGRFSSKLLKKGIFKEQHFNYNNNFLLHKKDEYTGRDKVIEYPNITANRDLLIELKQSAKSPSEIEKKKLLQLKDILDKMLILDPFIRISVEDCLKHPFLNELLLK